MWPYPWTHVGTPSRLGHMDRVAATMPSQAHAGAAQEAPDIGQWEQQDVPLVRPSSCNVKGGIPSSRRYLPTYLQALGYKYTWQRKWWRASHDSRFVANFSLDLHQEDRPAEEPSAPTLCKGGHHPGAATLCDFMAVARRSKAKAARPLHLKCSGPSSDVQSAHRGAPPRPGPSASSSSSVAPPPAAQQGEVARTCERVCGVPCNLRVARDQGPQQNAAVDRAVLIAKEAAAH